MKTLLFAYGTLMPGKNSPKTLSDYLPDSVTGNLGVNSDGYYTILPGYNSASEIQGVTMVIDEAELPALDAYEGPLYRRIRTQTQKLNSIVWIYIDNSDALKNSQEAPKE